MILTVPCKCLGDKTYWFQSFDICSLFNLCKKWSCCGFCKYTWYMVFLNNNYYYNARWSVLKFDYWCNFHWGLGQEHLNKWFNVNSTCHLFQLQPSNMEKKIICQCGNESLAPRNPIWLDIVAVSDNSDVMLNMHV